MKIPLTLTEGFSTVFLKAAFLVSREISGGVLEEIKFLFYRSVGKNSSGSFSKLRFTDPESFFGKRITWESLYISMFFSDCEERFFSWVVKSVFYGSTEEVFGRLFFEFFALRSQNWQITVEKNLHAEGMIFLSFVILRWKIISLETRLMHVPPCWPSMLNHPWLIDIPWLVIPRSLLGLSMFCNEPSMKFDESCILMMFCESWMKVYQIGRLLDFFRKSRHFLSRSKLHFPS